MRDRAGGCRVVGRSGYTSVVCMCLGGRAVSWLRTFAATARRERASASDLLSYNFRLTIYGRSARPTMSSSRAGPGCALVRTRISRQRSVDGVLMLASSSDREGPGYRNSTNCEVMDRGNDLLEMIMISEDVDGSGNHHSDQRRATSEDLQLAGSSAHKQCFSACTDECRGRG